MTEKKEIKTKFDVMFVCSMGCENRVLSPALKPYETDTRVRIIDSNTCIVCNECGKIMVPKVIKTTRMVVETEEILDIGWENANPERVQNEEKEN